MTLETFKRILVKLPTTVCQIALGIGSITANKDLLDIMRACRQKGIVPNITINGDQLGQFNGLPTMCKLCGGIAMSEYDPDAIDKWTPYFVKNCRQFTIHSLLSAETFDNCMKLMKRYRDGKLKGINAIVFLWLKPKGDRNTYQQVTQSQYKSLVYYALQHSIPIGFDSCSAPFFANTIPRYKLKSMLPYIESCESTLFSYYINVDGFGFPCSFADGEVPGISVIDCNDFVADVWNHKITKKFRKKCLATSDKNECRHCAIYNLGYSK